MHRMVEIKNFVDRSLKPNPDGLAADLTEWTNFEVAAVNSIHAI